MARIRSLKPSFFKNEDLAALTPWHRLCFQGLWCHADRDGRLEDRPRRLKAEIFPYDEIDVEPLLSGLADAGFIVRYEAEGSKYISIPTFTKHQIPKRDERRSTIPPPPNSSGTTAVPQRRRRPRAVAQLVGQETLGQELLGQEIPPVADSRKPHPIRELIGDYQQRFEAATGTKPSINGKRDASIFDGLLKDHAEDIIRASLGAFFADAYAIDAGFPLPLFRSQFSSYAAKAARASPSRAGPYAVPDVETTRRKYLTDSDPDERKSA